MDPDVIKYQSEGFDDVEASSVMPHHGVVKVT